MTNSLILIAVLIVGFLLLVALLQGRAGSGNYPYQLSQFLLSKAERSFYGVLAQAVGSTGLVFSKVRVADVITPKKGLSRSDWQRAFNAVSAKHFDFLVCDGDDCSVRFAVELDDSSHGSAKSKKRDDLLNRACDSAGLPLLRIKAARAYTVADLRHQIDLMLTPPHEESESPGSNEDKALTRESVEESESSPSCPKCGEAMLRRKAKAGSNAGQLFWGCSTFPKCRGVLKVNA